MPERSPDAGARAGTADEAVTVWVDGSRPSARIVEAATGAVLGVVSGLVLVGTHRMHGAFGGVDVPWGLAFGALYQFIASVLLVAWFGRKLALAALALVFALMAMLFATTSAGGGVLMPAQIAGVFQWQGWAVQLIGVVVPLIVMGIVWALQIRRIRALSR